MNLNLHTVDNQIIAEITADALVIEKEQDALRVMEAMYEPRTQSLILHQENIAADFFHLRSGLAGAVLQKFVNYQIRVAIVGDFSAVTSESLKAFIVESNRGDQIFFVDSLEGALQKLTGQK